MICPTLVLFGAAEPFGKLIAFLIRTAAGGDFVKSGRFPAEGEIF